VAFSDQPHASDRTLMKMQIHNQTVCACACACECASLKRRTSVINPQTKERGIVYTAGCKPVSAASAAGPAHVSSKDAEMEKEKPAKKSQVALGFRL
jgi:hypothetical protein